VKIKNYLKLIFWTTVGQKFTKFENKILLKTVIISFSRKVRPSHQIQVTLWLPVCCYCITEHQKIGTEKNCGILVAYGTLWRLNEGADHCDHGRHYPRDYLSTWSKYHPLLLMRLNIEYSNLKPDVIICFTWYLISNFPLRIMSPSQPFYVFHHQIKDIR
jgi:hypothetical protein